MIKYINYAQMTSSERHVFNSTGECPSVYLMSEGEYEDQLSEHLEKATQQAQDSDKFTVETVQ